MENQNSIGSSVGIDQYATTAAEARAAQAMYIKTEHFQQRQAQRKISNVAVILALGRGRHFYEGEEEVYFLGRKDIPRGVDADTARRADGTVVVVGPGSLLITTYRNPEFLRELKRRH